eukprot:gb/GEZN01011264.1/.p1 GENE.gb/GEZN01011264.1/~~gb/GEZN01011264.1/.p1  ORF type:complete len:204 (+),score=12.29 gb/GEZN01011264.1/:46-657(+)
MSDSKWGEEIRNMHAEPDKIKIRLNIERDGCCFAPILCQKCCPRLALRSYLWVEEAALEQNVAIWCCFDPCKGACCTMQDYTSKVYYDQPPFTPTCFGLCQPGLATHEDVCYFCFCINCIFLYPILRKPCCGEVLYIVPCPKDTCGYTCVTRCCTCCLLPVAGFLKDANQFKQALVDAGAMKSMIMPASADGAVAQPASEVMQ